MRNKKTNKDVDLSFSIVSGIIYNILFNIPIVFNKFIISDESLGIKIFESGVTIFSLFVISVIIFYSISFSKTLRTLISIFLYSVSAFASYITFRYGTDISPELIKVTLENTKSDALELTGLTLILWVIGTSVIGAIISLKYNKIKSSINSLGIYPIFVSILLLPIITLLIVFLPTKTLDSYVPLKFMNSTYIYLTKKYPEKKTDIFKEDVYSLIKESDNLNVILIIGESARSDHFSILGYNRETNPLLSKKKNLFPFNARSCDASTFFSVSCILSRNQESNFNYTDNETTLISIFKNLGFDVNIISTQTLLTYFKNTNTKGFYNEAHNVTFLDRETLKDPNILDEIMIPHIEKLSKKDGNKLIIIHSLGSHWIYNKRYRKEFEKFEPICDSFVNYFSKDPADCKKSHLINTYDNTILYTDYFISEIIDMFTDTNSFLIYTSDHGESLGEKNILLHGNPEVPEQRKVPLIFWGSDKYFENNHTFKKSILSNKEKILSHDYIFHSLLSCSGIYSTYIKSDFSLCPLYFSEHFLDDSYNIENNTNNDNKDL